MCILYLFKAKMCNVSFSVAISCTVHAHLHLLNNWFLFKFNHKSFNFVNIVWSVMSVIWFRFTNPTCLLCGKKHMFKYMGVFCQNWEDHTHNTSPNNDFSALEEQAFYFGVGARGKVAGTLGRNDSSNVFWELYCGNYYTVVGIIPFHDRRNRSQRKRLLSSVTPRGTSEWMKDEVSRRLSSQGNQNPAPAA